MSYTVTLPDNTTADFEDDVKPEDADRYLKTTFPEAFAPLLKAKADREKYGRVRADDDPLPQAELPELAGPVQTPSGKTVGEAAAGAFSVGAANVFGVREGGKWQVPPVLKQVYYTNKLADLSREEAALAAGRDYRREGVEGLELITPPTITPGQLSNRLDEVRRQKAEFQAKYGKNVEALNVAEQINKELRPEDATIVQDAAISFAGSSPTLLAALGLSTVSPALGIAVGAGGGMATQAAETEREAVGKGADWETAQRAGVINGVLEAVGDAFGLDRAFKLSKGGLLNVIKVLGYNGSQEGVTQFLEDVVSKIEYDPEKTAEEIGRNALVAFVAGTFGGGAASAVSGTVQSARQEYAEKQQALQDKMRKDFADAAELDRLLSRRDELKGRAEALLGKLETAGKERKGMEDIQPLIDNMLFVKGRLEKGERWSEVMKDVQDPKLRQILNATNIQERHDIQNPELTAKLTVPYSAWSQVTDKYVKDLAARGAGNLYQDPSNKDPDESRMWISTFDEQLLNGRNVTSSSISTQGQSTTPSRIEDIRHVLKKGDVAIAMPKELTLTPEQVKGLEGLRKTLEYWSKKLGYERAIIVSPLDELGSGRRGFASKYGEHGIISITDMANVNANTVRVAAHEFGHLLMYNHWTKASQELKNALNNAWVEDTQRHMDLPLSAAMAVRRGPAGAMPGEPTTVRSLIYGNSSLREHTRYLMSKVEWQAHQMERVLEGNTAGMKTPVKLYLRNLLGELRKFWNVVRGQKYQPNETFKDFIHHLALKTQVEQIEKRIIDLQQTFQAENMKVPDNQALSTLPSHVLANLNLPGDQTDLGTGLAASINAPEPKNLPRQEITSNWNKLLKKAGLPTSQKFNQDLDKFSKFKQLAYGILEVAFANKHIKQLYNPQGTFDPIEQRVKYGYVDYVLMMHRDRMRILQMADQTMKLWKQTEWKVSNEQMEGFHQFLVDQVLDQKFFDLNDPQVLLRYKLTPETIELYKAVRGNFSSFLDQFEQMQLNETRIFGRNNPYLPSLLKGVQEKFAKLRSIPYFPLMRFGEWVVTVSATEDTLIGGKEVKKGDTIIRAHFPRKSERDAEAVKLAREWQGHNVHTTTLPEPVRGFSTLPREFLESVRDKLDLTDKQQDALKQYLLELSPANAFSKRLMHRRGTAGFSMDLQRSFAAYFASGSNFLARAKYRSDLKATANELQITATDRNQYGDTTLRGQISDYVNKHLTFILNPENDWSNVRAPIAVAYLTGVFKTAFINATQPILVSAPWLSKRFGVAATVKELSKAYSDLGQIYQQTRRLTTDEQAIYDKWARLEPLTPEEQRFIEEWTNLKIDEAEALNKWLEERNALQIGVEEAGLNESLAMEMAGWAEGGLLQRVMKVNPVVKGVTTLGQWGMVPFEIVEKINRHTTFLAAYRLAKQFGEGKQGGLDIRGAQIFAREAVQSTQFEYSKYNQPQLTRGKKGLALMFMQYPLGMLRLMAGGDPSWKRIMAAAIFAGGMMGLPFAENLIDLIKFIDGLWGRFNPSHRRFDPKYEIKKLLEEVGEVPENLILHGASRYGFGLVPWADLSGSMSLGRLIPGTDAAAYFTTTGDFDAAMRMAVTEAGGAASSMVMRMLQAGASEGPPLTRLERGMPVTLIQQMMTSLRWYNAGAEELRSGANVVEFDPSDPWHMAEMVSKGLLGFQPRSVTAGRGTHDELGYEELRMRREFAQYYSVRRQMLLNTVGQERLDPDARRSALNSIREFNREVPFPSMKITGEQIQTSRMNRNKSRRMQERGLDVQKSEAGVMRDIGERRY